ncbi:MAG: ATP-dependent helicase [Christensenellaceae bacterium]|jgi:DNA helicase-2/ATP-dependent DNA helicase PcrA
MDLSYLNDVQQRAVTIGDGPILVLAGAGSGKTSVLTHRVAYLINEKGVDPFAILAITFTNKAAAEMKERIAGLVSFDTSRMAISTFHSMCARFLRRDADKIGYTNQFSIYDSEDCLSLVKKIMKEKGMEKKVMSPRGMLSIISSIKNSAGEASVEARVEDISKELAPQIIAIYHAYETSLQNENAMDFDDLLINMVKLLKTDEGVRSYYTNRFQYVLVDEYQDTNRIQYELIQILSEKHKNLFVVGDDDQSIYGWRGADIRNILEFEKDYKDATVIKLEQNYRSHQRILDVANAVICVADARKDKTPWSALSEGAKPKIYVAQNEYAEAEFIAREIAMLARNGKKYDAFAVLYRTHTQARVIEEKLRAYGIPYQVYGGISFYARKEIKDMVAYLTLIDNPRANTALLRIINTPKRGIGNVSIAKLVAFAEENGISLLEAMQAADAFMSGGRNKFAPFLELVTGMIEAAAEKELGEILEMVYQKSGYQEMLQAEQDFTAEVKIENIEEFINSAYVYEKEAEEPTLEGFLSTVSLISDMDTETEEGGVTLMTLHGAKGLEFDVVFMAGMEENLFPSKRSVTEGKLDEERRLCYVGITRAREMLYMTASESRNMYSGLMTCLPSRFLDDIPKEMFEDLSGSYEKKKAQPRPERNRDISFNTKVEFVSKATSSVDAFAENIQVKHPKFGEGTILSIVGEGEQQVATVRFDDAERKMFLALAPLEIITE